MEETGNTGEKLWFKSKTYGWGWVPVTWQGWALTLGYTAVLVGFALTLDENSTRKEVMLAYVLPMILFTAGFIRICYAVGEKPGWRWGNKDADKK